MTQKKLSSREAHKFIVRIPDEAMVEQIKQAAARDSTSMNAFVVQAIGEKLGRGARLDKLLDAVESSLEPRP